ncbi:hypothetical protein PFISCL1PPCAC_27158 [Pristionchus fissidentatus]|uniref:Uncharacterized protein n=1 Tax=Pristionchus fissidentatus TaxID=1538716 RepID=A0AAV5WV12_9BILA|nr:hypothetical protein PFISCL1PPCAC_27158 [Pristionchus fissidentatus]
MTSFKLEELHAKLEPWDKARIASNRAMREARFKGDFDKHAARILKMPRFCRADEEIMWLRNYRPDIPKYKTKILEWQVLVKFGISKSAAWRNMRKLLLPPPGQYKKSTDPPHAEVCAHLFHVICIDVMGDDRVMNRIREFVQCFTDEELSRFLHSAAEVARDFIPKYFVGNMLLRPDLIESQKDHIIDQMRGSPIKYGGFERIARLMGGLKFFFYTVEQADVLAESFVREIEDMYAIGEKDPLSKDLDNIGSCARHRANQQKMFNATFPFFKEYSVKRGFCGDTIKSVVDLACVIPTDANHHPIRRILTYAFLYHRRQVPSLEKRKIMGMWMNDFEWDTDLNGEIAPVKDEAFSYHSCFVSLARFINRFDMKSPGFEGAIKQAGGDNMTRLISLALIYDSQYEKALEIIDQFLNSRPYEECPHLYFTRMLALVRLKRFNEAIEIALIALLNAAKNDHTSPNTAPYYTVKRIGDANEAEEEEDEMMDEYLEDNEETVKKEKISTIHLITERDSFYYVSHLLVNLIKSAWNAKEESEDTYCQVLIALLQLDFDRTGKKLFDEVLQSVVKRKKFYAPSLLFNLQNRYIISSFSNVFHQLPLGSVVLCSAMNDKVGQTEDEIAKHNKRVDKLFKRVLIEASDSPTAVMESIRRIVTIHACDIFTGIKGNEEKEFHLPIEFKVESKEEKDDITEEETTNIEVNEEKDGQKKEEEKNGDQEKKDEGIEKEIVEEGEKKEEENKGKRKVDEDKETEVDEKKIKMEEDEEIEVITVKVTEKIQAPSTISEEIEVVTASAEKTKDADEPMEDEPMVNLETTEENELEDEEEMMETDSIESDEEGPQEDAKSKENPEASQEKESDIQEKIDESTKIADKTSTDKQ